MLSYDALMLKIKFESLTLSKFNNLNGLEMQLSAPESELKS